jgi:hypothetical protein
LSFELTGLAQPGLEVSGCRFGTIAVTEIERIVFLKCHRRTEVNVLGLVGDGEPAGADDPHYAIAAVENGIDT